MDSRQYVFNKSTLTVKFGNILESQSEVIVSSDDCYVSMGGGISRAILKEGGPCIKSDAQKMVTVPLGDAYYYGSGTIRDFEQAVKWYRKASEQGSETAKLCVQRLKKQSINK